MINSAGETSFILPNKILRIVQLNNPKIIPWVILKVNGIRTIAKKQGIPIALSVQSIFLIGVNMKNAFIPIPEATIIGFLA